MINIQVSSRKNNSTFLELSRSVNSGFEIIQLPELFNSLDETKLIFTTLNDSVIFTSQEPFRIKGFSKDLWITNEDSLVISENKFIPNSYFNLGFFNEIKVWDVTGDYNSSQQHIFYKNPDMSLSCYEKQILNQDYLIFQTFKSGYHFFIRDNYRDFSLYNSPFTGCNSFIYSSTIKFDDFFFPTAAIRSFIPASRLNTNQLYKAVIGDQNYFTDSIKFGLLQWNDDTISVFEPVFNDMYGYNNFYVIVDSIGKISKSSEQLYNLNLPIGNYIIYGIRAKLYEGRELHFDTSRLINKKFSQLLSMMPQEGFLISQNLGILVVTKSCRNIQIPKSNYASTWQLDEQSINDSNIHFFGAKTLYSASKIVELLPGFQAVKGSLFEAKIEEGCEK
ncbi:MAG: hypothetical protein NXI00_03350 [Cytophagales bacterium]|nr:hypothetical protein [Cytophagales bacterium]